MDHLRIYIESTFFRSSKFLLEDTEVSDFFRIKESDFMAVARRCAPSLSDDALRLIHKLANHDWKSPTSSADDSEGLRLPMASSIFRAIFYAAENLLIKDSRNIKVRFQNLFKWREITRLIGEDLFVTAFLASEDAFSYRNSSDIGNRLAYEPTLHNDNPDIAWLMKHERLHELHAHLNASSNIFNINWVCLMNYPAGRYKELKQILRTLDDEININKTIRIRELLVMAAGFRLATWRFFSKYDSEDDFNKKLSQLFSLPVSEKIAKDLHATISILKAHDSDLPDYIQPENPPQNCKRDFRVYLGERYFLYLCFLHIIRTEDAGFVSRFRFYLLVKALFREYMIQLNTNHGFANFKRYQDVKGVFVNKYPLYARMLSSLAIADSWRDSYIAYEEVRIAPKTTRRRGYLHLKNTLYNIDSELDSMLSNKGIDNDVNFHTKPDYGIIYHFIKMKDDRVTTINSKIIYPRNYNIRKDLRAQSHTIRYLFRRGDMKVKAIDAASSEFNCRPEVFGQAFRFLKHAGLKITFHAGEDYYDIADGLRAIDEAVTFLNMGSGDRIGHAIAMGIDPYQFYHRCERHVIVPAQWMLDNVVWLLFRAMDWNINIEPATESFLRSQFHDLYAMIYGNGDKDGDVCNERDYFESLLLRSDNPDTYRGSMVKSSSKKLFSDHWDNFRLFRSRKASLARGNSRIRQLFMRYHYDAEVRERGETVIEFKVCEGYARLIEEMQHRMMRRLERKHIIIECCPSSNLLIGSLDKYRNHPAFRFYEVDPKNNHHLKITLNTDDLGVFQTSLANEYSYMALALAKQRDGNGNPVYMPHQINKWLTEVARNGEKCRF